MVGAFLKPSSGRRNKPIHSISKQYSIQSLERDYKHYYFIIRGEVYEKKLFTAKDERFKCNSFLDEVKHSYTDLINIYVQDEKQKLQVFERGSVYLATKKIGKNNPKAQEIEADNQKRREWY